MKGATFLSMFVKCGGGVGVYVCVLLGLIWGTLPHVDLPISGNILMSLI